MSFTKSSLSVDLALKNPIELSDDDCKSFSAGPQKIKYVRQTAFIIFNYTHTHTVYLEIHK